MKRARGRIDFSYRPAPLLIDRRGAIAVALNQSSMFGRYDVLVDRVVATGGDYDFEIGLRSASLTWRNEEKMENLLGFALREMGESRVTVSTIRIELTYVQSEAEAFSEMISEMAQQIAGWPRLALSQKQLVDVGFMIDVEIGGRSIYLEIGPMEKWQLEAAIFAGKPAPPERMPTRGWYLSLKDHERLAAPSGYPALQKLVQGLLAERDGFAKTVFTERR
jgi:hypothetical protein